MSASTVIAPENTLTEQSRITTQVAVIVGSVRTDRFGPTPAGWITALARSREDLELDLIDLADYHVPPDVGGDDPAAPQPQHIVELGQRLAVADAFVIVTPVYNRSYPGTLKNAIDRFYTEWQLKPVGFVSYGGRTGGLQAIDALRGVFSEFQAVTLRDAIMFADFWKIFDHDGLPVDAEHTNMLADTFLDQLTWWATTLREGRTRHPYPFAASE